MTDEPVPAQTEPAKPDHLTVRELVDVLSRLRGLGVRTYVDMPGRGFQVEFFPVEGLDKRLAETHSVDVPAKVPDAEICPCGHPEYAHPNGPCVEGCSAEECEPKAKPA